MCFNETYSKSHTDKHLPDAFLTDHGLKRTNDLLSLLFNFASEYNKSKVKVNQEWLKQKLNHQLLVYADVSLLGKNINIIKKNTVALSDTCMQVGQDVKKEYVLMSYQQYQQTAEQNNFLIFLSCASS